jgi:hypothetical protein
MDWTFAIEKHKEALRRVVAMLAAMAGLVDVAQNIPSLQGGGGLGGNARAFPSPLWGGVRGGDTVSRRLHRTILRLLRPAEAATRRLIIIAARGITIHIAPPRRPRLKILCEGRAGTAIVDTGLALHQLGLANVAPRAARQRVRTRPLALPLTDTLRGLPRRRRSASASVPRISVSCYAAPHSIARSHPPSPDDPIDATHLRRRLAAIGRALDDLPGQAMRLARWRARRDRARARRAVHRLEPLRPGRPPGWCRPGSRHAHEVHRVLDELHGLAFWALELKSDTS